MGCRPWQLKLWWRCEWLFGRRAKKKWRLRLKRETVGLWAPLLEKGCCWPVEGDDEESGGCCCVRLPLEDGRRREETWFGLWWRRSWNCRREGRVKGYDSALFWSWRAGSGERKMRAGVCGVLWGWGRWRGWEREGLVRGCLGWEGDDSGGRRLREKEVRLRGGGLSGCRRGPSWGAAAAS